MSDRVYIVDKSRPHSAELYHVDNVPLSFMSLLLQSGERFYVHPNSFKIHKVQYSSVRDEPTYLAIDDPLTRYIGCEYHRVAPADVLLKHF